MFEIRTANCNARRTSPMHVICKVLENPKFRSFQKFFNDSCDAWNKFLSIVNWYFVHWCTKHTRSLQAYQRKLWKQMRSGRMCRVIPARFIVRRTFHSDRDTHPWCKRGAFSILNLYKGTHRRDMCAYKFYHPVCLISFLPLFCRLFHARDAVPIMLCFVI